MSLPVPLYDYGYLRALVWTGSFLVVFGMMMTSLSTEYWQLLLSQGLVVGLGTGMLFIPSIIVPPSYFEKGKALAMGIGAPGGALGGIIYPIIFHELQPQIGFGWSTRVIAFIMLVSFILPVLGMRMRERPPSARKLFDAQALKEPPFVGWDIFLFLSFMALYVPPFYIQLYGINNRITRRIWDSTCFLFSMPDLSSAG